jgi:uncharacterized protein
MTWNDFRKAQCGATTAEPTPSAAPPPSAARGTSAQRKRWFMNGFNTGQLSACDTFSAESL